MNRLLLTASLVVIAGLLITSTSTLPLDFEVHRQPTYYDLIFPKHDTPLPTWDIPVKRFLTEPLHCCTDYLYDIPALFASVKHRTFLIHYLYELRGNMHREISQATKNGTPTTLARFVPELAIRIYRLEENIFILYPHLRDQIMNRETGINGVQNEFEYSLVMFHNLLDLLNQIKERENITVIPVESLPEQGDLPKYLFTKEMNEKMDKDRRGLLSAWERMNPVEQCFDMTQRGLFCIAHVHGIETSIATQAPTTRRMSYFHKYQRKPRGRQPRRG